MPHFAPQFSVMLSGTVVTLLLGLFSLPALNVDAEEDTAVLVHRGAFSHQLSLVSSDASFEHLALTDEDELYLGVTVDDGKSFISFVPRRHD